jgi:hypothetical protein
MRPSFPIIPPVRLFSRAEVLQRPSPVPEANGLYAWYFRGIPPHVPTDDCLRFNGATLLYLGIAPDKANKPNSRSSLRKRICQHYRGNASGSTLRRALSVLLEEIGNFPLRRVGSGERIMLTNAGEQYLDEWMDKNAFVAWKVHPEPWLIEHKLLCRCSCPLNLSGNKHHPFYSTLKKLRYEAFQRARGMPIVNEHNQNR